MLPAAEVRDPWHVRRVRAGWRRCSTRTVDDRRGRAERDRLLSDVNSAARREFLTDVIPYRDVRYAEDQLFGRDLVEAGYRKAAAPRARSSTPTTSPRRARQAHLRRDRRAPPGRALIPRMSRGAQVRLTVRGILGDTLRILRDRDYSWKRKLYWLAVNPAFQVRKWATARDAGRPRRRERDRGGSLEHSRSAADPASVRAHRRRWYQRARTRAEDWRRTSSRPRPGRSCGRCGRRGPGSRCTCRCRAGRRA